ncbi:DUF6207 family protein [Streptomyces broussonetiae]|uniref:DUF6207 family protein n=1 Tax=Streptomyces broussonetiae TaxID=2686304 RepID=UPI0022792355|nr:DUF6207 family protein [Streptomyces broussonetiae]
MRSGRWATATSDRTTQDPRQPNVRLRCLTCARNSAHSPRRGVVVRCPVTVGDGRCPVRRSPAGSPYHPLRHSCHELGGSSRRRGP